MLLLIDGLADYIGAQYGEPAKLITVGNDSLKPTPNFRRLKLFALSMGEKKYVFYKTLLYKISNFRLFLIVS